MPASKTQEAEIERRAKISAATRGVPKGPRAPLSKEARVQHSSALCLVWSKRSAEDRTAIGTSISRSRTRDSVVEDPSQKCCKGCRRVLARTQFPRDSRNKDGLFGSCRECQAAKAKAWQAQHPDQVRAFRRSRYNIDFNALWEKQQGKCALCGDPMLPRGQQTQSVVVDHDHNCCPPRPGRSNASCGECVRGLLHHGCNLLLGLLEKNSDRLQQAQDYLHQWQEKVH